MNQSDVLPGYELGFSPDDLYNEVLQHIKNFGVRKGDRTGTGTTSMFGKMVSFDLRDYKLPFLTGKQLFYKSFIHETLWFLSGSTDVAYLKTHGISIWDSWVEQGSPIIVKLTVREMKIAILKRFGVDLKRIKNFQFNSSERVSVAQITQVTYHSSDESVLITLNDKLHAALGVNDQPWDKIYTGLCEALEIPTHKLLGGRIEREFATTKDRVAAIKKDDPVLGEVRAFFEKYSPARRDGEIVVWAEDYKVGGVKKWLNKDGHDFLPDFLDKLNVPDKHLVGGSIGPGAYGSMWRNIEDIRILTNEELAAGRARVYQAKGFECEGALVDGRQVWSRHIDQVQNVVELLRTNPDSRRIIVAAFDNRMVDFCQLPPCHSFWQVWSRELELQERVDWFEKHDPTIAEFALAGDRTISHEYLDDYGVPKRALTLGMYQRSCDFPVGGPFNINQYGLLAHMLAHITGHIAEELVWIGADVHIYNNQFDLVEEQLSREPMRDVVVTVNLNHQVKEIDSFKFEDIKIVGYDKHHPRIDYPVAV